MSDEPTLDLTVREALAQERPLLLPRPAHPFPCEFVVGVHSGKTPYIRFDFNDYSIPSRLTQIPLSLAASETSVRILHVSEVVVEHPRSWDRGQRIEDPSHIHELRERKRQAHELRGRDRLRLACPRADDFIRALALRGAHLGGNTSRLLKLLDRFGPALLDDALAVALDRNAVSAASVAHIIDGRLRASSTPPPVEPVLPDHPFVRDLRVAPHALAPYDALAKPKKEKP